MSGLSKLIEDIELIILGDGRSLPKMAKKEALERLRIEWAKDSHLSNLLYATREYCYENKMAIKVRKLIAALKKKE
mgnify:CR=1 FL=1